MLRIVNTKEKWSVPAGIGHVMGLCANLILYVRYGYWYMENHQCTYLTGVANWCPEFIVGTGMETKWKDQNSVDLCDLHKLVWSATKQEWRFRIE